MPGWDKPEDVPEWARPENAPPTQAPDDMEAFLKDPPKPPRSCPEGTSLWLLGKKLDDKSMQVFARTMMRGDWAHLTYCNMGLNTDITGIGFSAFCGALANGTMPLVENLNFSGCKSIGDEGAIALAAALPAVPNLQTIEASEAGIGDKGVKALFESVGNGNLPNLKQWFLKGNPMADEGMMAICECAEKKMLPKLHYMNLCETKVADEGCLALSIAIEEGHFNHVRQFYMHQCAASRDGLEVLTGVLKEYDHKYLQVLF